LLQGCFPAVLMQTIFSWNTNWKKKKERKKERKRLWKST